jgi:predicted peptidase
MKSTFMAVLIAVVTASAAADQRPHTFASRSTRSVSLPYLLHVPAGYRERPSWPVILYLHGGSVRGTDVEKLRSMGLPRRLENEPGFPFIVVSPLLPKGEIWSDADALIALLDDVMKRYATDAKRVFVTGHSMGGRGALYLAFKHPDRFAAVAALSAFAPINDWAARLKGKRVWYFHGARDVQVPIATGDELVSALKAAGADVRYSRLDDRDHFILDAYDAPDIYDWFLRPPHSK